MIDQNEMTHRVVFVVYEPIYACTPDICKRLDTAGLKRNDHLCMFSRVLQAIRLGRMCVCWCTRVVTRRVSQTYVIAIWFSPP
jgi:hypothetical protein